MSHDVDLEIKRAIEVNTVLGVISVLVTLIGIAVTIAGMM